MSFWCVGKEHSIRKGGAMRILLLILGLIAAVPASAQSDIAADWGGVTLHLPIRGDDHSLDTLLDLAQREAPAVFAANGTPVAADADPAPSGPASKVETPATGTGPDRGGASGSLLSRLTPLEMGVIVLALAIVTLALVMLANQRPR
jgi:hypothetical protein